MSSKGFRSLLTKMCYPWEDLEDETKYPVIAKLIRKYGREAYKAYLISFAGYEDWEGDDD